MNPVDTLSSLVSRALTREPARPAIEFEQRWFTWGEMRQVADRIGALVESSGAPACAPVAFIPRNRPSAVATLLGLIAKNYTVRMIYAFQSGPAIARDIARLEPAVVIAAPGEFSEEVLGILRDQGIAGIAIDDMDANAVPGLE